MELQHLLSLDKWGAMESDLYQTYNLQGSVFNVDGIRITDTKNWSNPLCPSIKSTEKGQSYICAVAHMNMAAQAMNTKKPVIEECDAGMLKLVVPIFYDNVYLGVMGGCGLLAETGEIDSFAIHRLTDIPETEIDTLSSGVPTISYEKAHAACDYIKKNLDKILTEYNKKVTP